MKKIFQALAFIAGGVAAGLMLHECRGPGTSGLRPQHGVEVDTIPYYDTIPYRVPVAKQEATLGARVVFVPVVSPGDKPAALRRAEPQALTPGQTCCAEESRATGPATGTNRQTGRPDSVAVELPITQREYAGEEYHAWVSGYEPSLDSIFVFPRHDVVTVRDPPLRSDHNQERRRWGIGVFAGYGITPQGLGPCAGVSINYNIWSF